ncbi:MAG TPA: hypothetical protein VK666_13320 [Chryseolinea sp.]|nr:hypothetical protein [Chryseolinea sp.]
MRKSLLLFILIASSHAWATAADKFALQFKIRRPYCVLNFLETCKGANGTSDALRIYIENSTKSDTLFSKLIEDYHSLDLDGIYQHSGFPETRPAYRSIKDLLIIAAVQSNNIDEFKQQIIGVLHSSDYEHLINIMKKADVWYEKIIWSKHGKQAIIQLEKLETYQPSINDAFQRLKKFYGSSWPDDMPFIIALSPVPGKTGATAATPHANSLCLDVLTEEINYAARIAIALHEICHVLYAEQSRQLQHELENYFAASTSAYASAAHNFFDEGLATANGNGWTYKLVTGKMDTAGWYSDTYIDGFGHALYPLTSRYLSEGKSIDESFAKEAIRLFGEKFPKAPDDFGILFNHLVLNSDEEEPVGRNRVKQNIYARFSVYYLNFTSPIMGAESGGLLKDSRETQLIVVDRNYETTLNALKNALPELNKIHYNLNDNFIISYFDGKKRLVMVAKINKGDTDKLFEAIKKRQFVNRTEPYWRL